MSWQSYVDNLMARDPDGTPVVMEAAIVGTERGKESVWASSGSLANITGEEIRKMIDSDGTQVFTEGVKLAGVRCTTIRDERHLDSMSMDLKTKTTPEESTSYGISFAITKQALVIVKGCQGVHSGALNKRAYDVADYLRKLNF